MSISRSEITTGEDALLKSGMAFDYVTTPVIAADVAGKIVIANLAAQKLTGYTFDELKSQPLVSLVAAGLEPAIENAHRCALAGEAIDIDCGLRVKQGIPKAVKMHLRGIVHRDYAEGVIATLQEVPSPRPRATRSSDQAPSDAANAIERNAITLVNHLFGSMPDFVALVRVRDERIVRVNDKFYKVTGMHPADVVGRTSSEAGLWQDLAQRARMWEQLRTQHEVKDIEMEFRSSQTGARQVNLEANITLLDNEPHVLVIGRDVTEQRATERKLRDSAARFESQFRHGPIPKYSWRRVESDFVLIDYNLAAEAETKGAVAHLVGKSAQEVYRDNPAILDCLERCYREQRTLKHELWYPMVTTGEQRYIVATYIFIAPDVVTVHVQDLTGIKRAENALRESESRLRSMVDANPVGIFFSNVEGRVFEANPALLNLVGYTHEEFIGRCVNELEITAPEYHELARTAWAALERGESVRPYQQEFVRKDGTRVPVLVGKSDIGSGMIVGFVVDFTELKEAERKIEFQAKLLDHVNHAIVTVDERGGVTYWNRATESLYHIQGQPLHGREFATLIGASVQRVTHLIDDALAGAARSDAFEVTRHDGTHFYGLYTTKPLYDQRDDVIGAIVVVLDISEQKKLEEDAVKAQRLESIGLLAGGIAHDFNNVLTAILGNISLAKLHTQEPGQLEQALLQAEKGFWRARELTNQLLTFARGGTPVRKLGSLTQLIIDTCQFALAGAKVGLKLNIAPDLWPANFDAGQISQVVNNLVVNAKDAMPNGGTLTVEAKNMRLNQEIAPLPQGKYIGIDFDDTGVGIAPEHLAKIFDPYFSTKNRGSGLGLAMVYSILTRHGGHITVESQVAAGTRFSLYLPAAEREERKQPRPPSAPTVHRLKVGGNVLLMDDDKMIRDVARQLLQGLGYSVELASDGAEAVALYKNAWQKNHRFIAVILDLTVPGGMGGRECLAALKLIDPNVNAIVSSGYSNDPVVADYERYGFKAVINKPYRLDDLKTTLTQFAINAGQ